MKFNNVTKQVKKMSVKVMTELDENKPTLLMYGGVFGVVTVGATGINGAIKAKEIFDANDGKISKDVAINMAKCFVPFGLATVGTILCVIGIHKEYVTKVAALAAVHAADTFGDKMIPSEVNAVNCSKVKPEETIGVKTFDGKKGLYDEYAGRFTSVSVQTLQDAIDNINECFLTDETSVPASMFYEELMDGYNVPECVNGKHFYSSDGLLRLEFDSAIDEDFNPYIIFRFNRNPETDAEHSLE